MRALIATVILALVDAPLRAAGDPSLAPPPPPLTGAQVNAPVSIGAAAIDEGAVPASGADPRAADAATAPAAPEDRLLGPRPPMGIAAGGAGPGAGRAEAGRAAWGIGAGEIIRVVTALAAVLALLLGARAFMRRLGGTLRGGGRPGGIVNILGRYPLARGQHLLLLRLGAGRIILVHQSRAAMTTLAELTDPDEVARLVARIEAGAARPAVAGRFQALLGKLAAEDDARQVLDGNEVVDLTRRSRRAAGRPA